MAVACEHEVGKEAWEKEAWAFAWEMVKVREWVRERKRKEEEKEPVRLRWME